MLENFPDDVILALVEVGSAFADHSVEPVLYHVFGALVVKLGHYFRPTFSRVLHVFENNVVLLWRPCSVYFVVVEMVEPSFTTVFGRFEDAVVRVVEYPLGDVIPLAGLFCPHCQHEKLVVFLAPAYSALGF